MEQGDMFADLGKTPTLQEEFEAFHRQNPHVFLAFAQAARELKESGRKRFGAKAIVERLRWYANVATGGSPFKLDNRWTSRYARLLLEEHPQEFRGFLELRQLKAE